MGQGIRHTSHNNKRDLTFYNNVVQQLMMSPGIALHFQNYLVWTRCFNLLGTGKLKCDKLFFPSILDF